MKQCRGSIPRFGRRGKQEKVDPGTREAYNTADGTATGAEDTAETPEEKMSGKIRRIICAALCAALCAGPGTALPAVAEENGEGILKDIQTEQASGDGFTIPYPAGGEKRSDEAGGLLIRSDCRDGESTYVFEGKLFLPDRVIPGGFAEDPEKARELFENHLQNADDPNVTDYQQEMLETDGHPALAERYEYRGEGGSLWSIGRLWYPRNNRILRISIVSAPKEDNGGGEGGKVTMADLKTLASKIVYNEEEAPLTRKNAEITVTVKGSPTEITAGRSLQFAAEFADKTQINWKARNNGITWTVTDAETGEATDAATITDNGKLTTNRKISEPVKIEVRAASEIFGTVGKYQLEVKPK